MLAEAVASCSTIVRQGSLKKPTNIRPIASPGPRELPKGKFYRMAVDSSPLRWWRTWADPAALEVGSGAEGEAGVVVV